MTEPVKIHPPKGYEVCPTSTQTEIRFRPISKIEIKPNKPKWKDFGRLKGYWVRSDTSIGEVDLSVADSSCRNTWPTKEEAEACLALSQLCQWRDKYNEGWKPDWKDTSIKWVIERLDSTFHVCVATDEPKVLYFKEEQTCDKFLEDFRELIEIAKPLL